MKIQVNKNFLIIDEENIDLTTTECICRNDEHIVILTELGNHYFNMETKERAQANFKRIMQKLTEYLAFSKCDENIIVNVSNLESTKVKEQTVDGKLSNVVSLQYKTSNRVIECGTKRDALNITRMLEASKERYIEETNLSK